MASESPQSRPSVIRSLVFNGSASSNARKVEPPSAEHLSTKSTGTLRVLTTTDVAKERIRKTIGPKDDDDECVPNDSFIGWTVVDPDVVISKPRGTYIGYCKGYEYTANGVKIFKCVVSLRRPLTEYSMSQYHPQLQWSFVKDLSGGLDLLVKHFPEMVDLETETVPVVISMFEYSCSKRA